MKRSPSSLHRILAACVPPAGATLDAADGARAFSMMPIMAAGSTIFFTNMERRGARERRNSWDGGAPSPGLYGVPSTRFAPHRSGASAAGAPPGASPKFGLVVKSYGSVGPIAVPAARAHEDDGGDEESLARSA